MRTDGSEEPGTGLNELLDSAGLEPVTAEIAAAFDLYLSLLSHWNSRLNLTAVRDPESMRSRHFVESIACARALPKEIHTLLDFGSGAGFPGIPIALCRPEIAVTLAESQTKKAAFLRETVRQLKLEVRVHSARAETIPASFDCVVLRAVDRMTEAVEAASTLVAPGGWLALMTTRNDLPRLREAAGEGFAWGEATAISPGTTRILAQGKKSTQDARGS